MKAAPPPVSGLPPPAERRADAGAAFERECVAFFAEVVQVFGVPKSVGQIYGLVYASPAPLSFSDIVERLEISKGSASQGLQLLRSLGAINVVGKRPLVSAITSNLDVSDAPRRDYFEPELSLRKLVSGILRERVAPLTATGTDRLARLRELAERVKVGSDFYLDRVRQLETWRRRLKTVVPVLSILLGPKSKM